MQVSHARSSSPIKRTLAAAVACASLLASLHSGAADMYQVEVVVFTNEAGYSGREVWPSNLDLTLPEPLTVLRDGDGVNADVSPDLNAFEKLPATALTLRNEAAALARSQHRILLHAAWLQRIGGSETNVYLEGGNAYAPYHEFAGTLRLTRQQFVHVDTNLWLARFKRAGVASPAQAPASATENAAPVNWPLPPLPPQLPDGQNGGDNDLNDMLKSEYAVDRIVVMQQHRRLKQNELNYLDHPLMGALIKVSPAGAAQGATASAATPAP